MGTTKSLFSTRSGDLGPLSRFAVNSVVMGLALGIYMVTSSNPLGPLTSVTMPAWVPFWPSFTLVYLSMLLVAWLLPVAIRDPKHFRSCLRASVCAFLLVVPCWILNPTTMPRPPLPEDSWSAPYRWLVATDPPNNILPCAHGIGPVVAAWFLALDRPRWRAPLIAMLVVGLPSIALVWQHRPVDILLGTAASAIGIALERTFRKKEPHFRIAPAQRNGGGESALDVR